MNDMRYDVVVVGAGQAGLAIGHFLAEQGSRFVILEAADSVGSAWRERWDSLVLFTPRRYDALPGLRVSRRPGRLPDARRGGSPTSSGTRRTSSCRSSCRRQVALAEQGRRTASCSRRGGPRDPADAGRRRDRAVPGAERAGVRRELARRGLPDAQRRLPPPGGRARGHACSWSAAATPASRSRRSSSATHEVVLSRRLPADAAAAAPARSRPLLVARRRRACSRRRSTPVSAEARRPRHPDRLEPARRSEAPGVELQAAGRRRRRAARSASPTAASSRSTQ